MEYIQTRNYKLISNPTDFQVLKTINSTYSLLCILRTINANASTILVLEKELENIPPDVLNSFKNTLQPFYDCSNLAIITDTDASMSFSYCNDISLASV